MADSTTGLTPQEQRFESEHIHASALVLLLAAIGLAIWSIGRLVNYGQSGSLVACVGLFVMAIAIVLHIEHLSFRIGRSAVVLLILGVCGIAVGNLLAALDVSGSVTWIVKGFGWVTAGAGVAMVAVHKEGQMKAALADYASGKPWTTRVTVHASFLSLITGAIGLVLLGVGLVGQDATSSRTPYVLQIAGGVLVVIGMIRHFGHLAPRIGRVAVVVTIAALLLFAANTFPDAIDPENAASHVTFWHVCIGIAGLLGVVAFLLALQKKLSTD
ncbi:MAG: hypothetical protein F2947_05390 [Actinobacteria bacterium]|uniref:Unannotated protein n=1 Tax=freshwater metagenome TaxID=449393 RepID=A0A6J5ZR99_9ZZZZ|nr:hypothetical protein [Actinomycetota bacterium]MSW32135.1 hypothetical protein [Actinomycetota bacterium]MSX34542.1 hypothetical protein [Actinomycetota bacterium]MSX95014.1 hypothetical protein [Actinomycetota bacterium]MTA42352.1 hypothetical protein [Actinomycetota bacterium]